MRCNEGHEWDENGVCKVDEVNRKRTFEVEIEILSTYIVYVDAEDESKAKEMIFSGEYDTNAKESVESDTQFRDLISIKEQE